MTAKWTPTYGTARTPYDHDDLLTTRTIHINGEILHVTYRTEPPDNYGNGWAYEVVTCEYGGVDIWPVVGEIPAVDKAVRRGIIEGEIKERSEYGETPNTDYP